MNSACFSSLCPLFQSLPLETPREFALSGRRMLERELGVARLVKFDHERHSPLRAAKREWLARVLERDWVHVLEVAIGATLDHAPSKLGFLVRVEEVDDGEGDTRIALRVLPFERAFSGTDQDAVIFTAYPNGYALR